jgi:putative DNA-invertase from lambdoid prophage Rac
VTRRCAAYLRVSTDRQETSNQRPALERLAAARDLDVVWFEETASGAKARPVLDDLCQRARQGEFSTLLVWAVDRLGRSMFETIDRVRQLDAAGVRVVSHQETWLDLGGPCRGLLLGVFSWVAEQERDRLRERTKAGLVRARAQGKRLGRPKASPLALEAALALLARGANLADAACQHKIGRSTLARYAQSQKRALAGREDPHAD